MVQAHAPSLPSPKCYQLSKSVENRGDGSPFESRRISCTLINLVMKIQGVKIDEHQRLTFPVKQNKLFHFCMLKSIISYIS